MLHPEKPKQAVTSQLPVAVLPSNPALSETIEAFRVGSNQDIEVSPQNVARAEKILAALSLPSNLERLKTEFSSVLRMLGVRPNDLAESLQRWEDSNWLAVKVAKSRFSSTFSDKNLLELAMKTEEFGQEMARIQDAVLRDQVRVYTVSRSGPESLRKESIEWEPNEPGITAAHGIYGNTSCVLTRVGDQLRMEIQPYAPPPLSRPEAWVRTAPFVSWDKAELEGALRAAIRERDDHHGVLLSKREKELMAMLVTKLRDSEFRARLQSTFSSVDRPSDLDQINLDELLRTQTK